MRLDILNRGYGPGTKLLFAFNTTDRLADAFGFEVLSPEAFAAGAKYLLKRGYR
jgi:hypothetical protein